MEAIQKIPYQRVFYIVAFSFFVLYFKFLMWRNWHCGTRNLSRNVLLVSRSSPEQRVSRHHGTSHWWVKFISPHPNSGYSQHTDWLLTWRSFAVTAIMLKSSKSRIETELGSHSVWLLLVDCVHAVLRDHLLLFSAKYFFFFSCVMLRILQCHWFTFVPTKMSENILRSAGDVVQ